jgi:hypothetical protein
MAQCKDCRSYITCSNKGGWGQCRRYPPAWKLDGVTLVEYTEGKSTDATDTYHFRASFSSTASHPDTQETDWCSEYQVGQLLITSER